MPLLLLLSLLINVLVPICAGLLLDPKWTTEVYGPNAQARGILISIYLAILGLSAVLLMQPRLEAAATLLLMQIVYKVTTPWTTGSWRNPVVLSNLTIPMFHGLTLIQIFKPG